VTNEPARPRTRGSGSVLFRVRGVPIVVSASWLLVGLLLPIIYGPVLQDAVPGLGATPAYAAAFGFAVVFGGCVLAHELGHTLVSVRLGHPVRRIVLFALGGVSEIESEPERPRDELLIAAAGPLVSVLITAAAWLGSRATTANTLIAALVELLFWSNLVLAGFNLLPGLPLDGGRLLRAAVWKVTGNPHRGTIVAGWGGRVAALLVLAYPFLGQVLGRRISPGDYVVSVIIALFLWTGASSAIASARVRRRLPTLRARALARRTLAVAGDLPLAEAVRLAQEEQAGSIVVLDTSGMPHGIVNEAAVLATPADRRPWMPVSAVARTLEPGLSLPADIAGEPMILAMQRRPASEYLLLDPDGSIFGVLVTEDVDKAFAAGAPAG
jgi:Zn-dependent protease/CBS domain-containing protein